MARKGWARRARAHGRVSGRARASARVRARAHRARDGPGAR
jgi:hypothetical protein